MPLPSADPHHRHARRDARSGGGARTRGRGPALALSLASSLVLSLALFAPMHEARADAGSRGEAIEEALASNGGEGKVLGVREERTENGVVYAVKVLTDGRVRVFRIRGR